MAYDPRQFADLVLNFHARADSLDADALIERLLKAESVEENR
jgi:hypothetical protein